MTRLLRVFDWIRTHRRKLMLAGLVGLACASGALFLADRTCRHAAEGRIYSSPETVPVNEVGLVLGTGKLTAKGNPNLHFTHRIEAAARLYHSGKVRHLLVSGDNSVPGYDEPTDMQEALIALGVPKESITCDYAGFRTLDSIVRANEVFGLARYTVVTEAFHCPRALWIARQHGIDAVAFAAPDVGSLKWSAKVKARECLARFACALDLYVLGREPKFTGPKEPILVTNKR